MRHGGSFACQGEQHSRQPRSQLDQHVEQEVDVLLMGDATDVHQHRPIGRDTVPPAECRAVATRELASINAGRQDRDRPLDPVRAQHLLHRRRRDDDPVERVALPAAHAARCNPEQAARQERHVVMEVLFEVRVPGLDHRQPVPAGPAHTGRVRDERRLDMHHVDPARIDTSERTVECAAAHQPVFRVHRHASRRDAMHVRIGRIARPVTRHHQRAAVLTVLAQAPPEGGDRGRDTVHAREEHVRNHQDVHGARPRSMACKTAGAR